jgi:hypothetical protein
MSQASDNIGTPVTESNPDDKALRLAMIRAANAKVQAKKATAAKPAKASAPAHVRKGNTLESARLLAPNAAQAANIARTFGHDLPDFESIRDTLAAQLTAQAATLTDAGLNDTALKIHLERVVAAYVGSANGAAAFYSAKVSDARRLTTQEGADRDEDLDGRSYSGLETKAQRARAFAAVAAMQAHAVLALAEGACQAFRDTMGTDWTPYVPSDGPKSTPRRAAAAELDAFG